jgi:tRNA(fMet)-specific endonuclease VapC
MIVACELRFGAAKRGSPKLSRAVEAILDAVPTLPLDASVSAHYADIRSHLEAGGTPIGGNDLLIAAHARSIGATIVTRNAGEFQRVPGLDVAVW